jgi:hypothetical protein
LASHPEKLSAPERREVKDDLCIIEFTIGRPTYSLKEQQRVCTDASAEPGSRTGEVLARIDAAIVRADDDQIEGAIKAGDLASAEAAIEDYEATPGANQVQVAQWSNRMWKLVKQGQAAAPSHHEKAMLGHAIAAIKREHRDARKMSDAAFQRWVVKTATADGTEMVREPQLDEGKLTLDLARPSLGWAALNLDKFAQINDAVVARCGCNARTDIGIGKGNLPAYMVRLDAETRQSEVLILLSGERIGPSVSLR